MNLRKAKPDLFYNTILGKKIICFGSGKFASDAIRALKIRDFVECFYDNSKNKWDSFAGFHGKLYQVKNPARLSKLRDYRDYVLLITNRDHYQEILKQLEAFDNLRKIEVFIFTEFDRKEIHEFQKTEKYDLIQKYWKYTVLKRDEKRLGIGLRLLNYVLDDNMFWAFKVAGLAMQQNDRLSALRILTKLVNAGYEIDKMEGFINEKFSVYREDTDSLLDKNLDVLRHYPCFFDTGDRTKDADSLKHWIYFQEGNSIFPYDTKRRWFGHEITQGPERAFCTLEDDGKPVFLDGIYNEWLLQALGFIVRDSDKYGGDNRVYLYYEDADEFYSLLRVVDFSLLKEKNKFVILLGKENKGRYPMAEEQLEEKREAELLSVDEMQQICILVSNPSSGSGFFSDVMTSNQCVVGNVDRNFYVHSSLPESFHDVLKDTKKRYSYREVLCVFENYLDDIVMPEGDRPFCEYVDFFRRHYSDADVFGVADLWKIYFIAKYYLDGGTKQTRFVPCIFWDIHMGERADYSNMLKEFAIVDYLVPVRDPIVKLARNYTWNIFGWTYENQYKDLNSVFFNSFDHEWGYTDIEGHKCIDVRFEDCKLYPQEMFRKICCAFCIPYHASMFDIKADGVYHDGEQVKGFDPAPLNRRIDQYFSDFDKVRLEMFYSQISEHYGYDSYDFDEQPVTDEEAAAMFAKPFRIERELYDTCYSRVDEDIDWKPRLKQDSDLGKNWFENKEELHDALEKLLIKGYRISRYEKIRFPFLIRKSIQGADFEEF